MPISHSISQAGHADAKLESLESVAALTFGAKEQSLALPLQQIERVIAAVALSAWPDAPHGIAGVIDVAGRMVAVLRASNWLPALPMPLPETTSHSAAISSPLDLERRFQQPRLSDHFLLVYADAFSENAHQEKSLLIALWAEQLGEVVSLEAQARRGVAWSGWQPMALPQGLVLLGDSTTLLNQEQRRFARAIAGHDFAGELVQ